MLVEIQENCGKDIYVEKINECRLKGITRLC